jgi:tetrahydromethanopterin S-methyltransferase subunit B|tara:strand:+ start:246 stop:428 length:183 start_codon:yes stop_codon:yes gene_type:complete
MVRIKGCPDFVRDPDTGAVININDIVLKQKQEKEERLLKIESDVSELKDTLNEILTLLRK